NQRLIFVLEFRARFLRQCCSMLSRTTPITSKAAAAMGLLLICLTGCHHPLAPARALATAAASAPVAGSPATPAPGSTPKVKYNETYDPEIKEIVELAGKERWEEAQAKAEALVEKAPQNAMVKRVHGWVLDARQKRREQALEDKIREI